MRKDRLSQCSKTVFNRIRIYFQIITSAICLFLICLSGVAAVAQPDKYYLRIGHGESHDSNEINVTTLGVVSLKDNMVGHFDLSYLDSDTNGQAAALEFGAGFAFNWYVSPYLSIGASLGYNWDKDEAVAAYFPELGVVVDVTKRFGITFSGRRYYSLYQEDEDIIMLGLVFRK